MVLEIEAVINSRLLVSLSDDSVMALKLDDFFYTQSTARGEIIE